MQNGFTWFWEGNDWFPWRLPNTTDYMYSTYHLNSASRRDPGVYEYSSFGEFVGCGDSPPITLESGMEVPCQDFFPGFACMDEMLTNYSSGNCSASCGYCTNWCFDIELSATNSHGYGCELYNEMPILCDIAETYDDEDFTASFHCCACGGGSQGHGSSTCLPNDFVYAGPNQVYSMVRSLNRPADTITVEFMHAGTYHEFPRTEVQKHNGHECNYYSHTMFEAAWAMPL